MPFKLNMGAGHHLIALVAALAMGGAAAIEPEAEYAFRWKSTEGGPATLESAAALMGADGPPAVYSIRFFSSTKAASNPSATPILRERQGKNKTEVTWKYRSTAGWSDIPDGTWCPLLGDFEEKREVDITVDKAGAVRRVYSRSCTVEADLGAALPAGLVGAQRGCTATMTRRKSSDKTRTVEAWKLSGDKALILEVSRKGPDTPEAAAAFRTEVVGKLVTAGARSIDRSKTELGTECK